MNNIRRGWCPSLFKPMETGDGFLCRIKPFFGSMTSDQARFIAQLSMQYGNGHLNLSQKGNLQLRGFTRDHIDIVIPKIIHEGLGSNDPQMEERRNILLSPLYGLNPLCNKDGYSVAQDLQTALQSHPDLHPLTGKFSFIIDAGGQFNLQHHYADINIRFIDKQWMIQLGQSSCVIRCNRHEIINISLDIIRFCIQHQIKRLIQPQYAEQYLKQTNYTTTRYTNDISPDPMPVGFHQFTKRTLVHIAIPFGLLEAQQLSYLATVADQYGDGTIRFTPWRSVILPDCAKSALPYLSDFITQNDDPRLYMTLCPGKPFCLQAQQETIGIASDLFPIWKNQKQILHMSGCAKGCASPQINPVTLSATKDGYNLIFNGNTHQNTPYQNLKLTEIINLLQKDFLPSSEKHS